MSAVGSGRRRRRSPVGFRAADHAGRRPYDLVERTTRMRQAAAASVGRTQGGPRPGDEPWPVGLGTARGARSISGQHPAVRKERPSANGATHGTPVSCYHPQLQPFPRVTPVRRGDPGADLLAHRDHRGGRLRHRGRGRSGELKGRHRAAHRGQRRASPARNLGAEHSHGEILLFLDGDIALDPDSVENAVDILRSS